MFRPTLAFCIFHNVQTVLLKKAKLGRNMWGQIVILFYCICIVYCVGFIVTNNTKVTARSKAQVCDSSPSEIVGSNSTGVMNACLLCELCFQVEVSATS